jgi:hypothetical protein
MKKFWRILPLALLLVVVMTTQAPAEGEDQNGEEVLAELQGALKWDDKTTAEVGKALAAFQENMAAVMAKYEDAEEPDPQSMIGDMKKVKGDYQKQLEGILGKDGLQAYNDYVEAVMLDMFSDIAEIRLLDLKPILDLTDEQIQQLREPMGQAYLDLLRTVFKYGDQNMNTRTKIKMGKAVKGIQSSIEVAQKEVLTEEQLAALEKYKEEQKAAQESGS